MKKSIQNIVLIFLFLSQNSFADVMMMNAQPEQPISMELQVALVDYANVALLTILDTNRSHFRCTDSILEQMDSEMEGQVNGLFLLSQSPASAVELNPSVMKKIKLDGVLKMKTPELRLLLRDMFPRSSKSLKEAQKCFSNLESKYQAN